MFRDEAAGIGGQGGGSIGGGQRDAQAPLLRRIAQARIRTTLQTDDEWQGQRFTRCARDGHGDADSRVIDLLTTEELVFFPLAFGDRGITERGARAAGRGVDREIEAVAIKVVGRCDQKIDADLVRTLGGGGDLEGFLGRQELRIT